MTFVSPQGLANVSEQRAFDDRAVIEPWIDSGSTQASARDRRARLSHILRAGHPRWLRCSSLKYAQYSHSSRLAIGAPRSGIYATNHAAGTLAGE